MRNHRSKIANISAEIRPSTSKLEIPIDVHKMHVYRGQFTYGMRLIDETPKRHIIGKNRVN
jgi:hypothetical protein